MDKKPTSLLQKLKKPTGWFFASVILITFALCAGAVAITVLGSALPALEVLSYALFGAAAISLGYAAYAVVINIRPVRDRIIAALKRHSFTSRILEQYGFRTVVFAAFSLLLSLAYVAFNGVVAVASRSIWYGALTAYYLLLVCLRGGIVLYHRRKGKSELSEDEIRLAECRKYRNCGALLMILPVALSGAILQMVRFGSAFVHWGWTVLAFAAYAFYKIIMAAYNVVKAKKTDDLTVRALRNVGLAAAMVTMLALQTSLLHSFSESADYGWANALTGGVISALTFALGLYMLIGGNRRIARAKTNLSITTHIK